MLDLFSRRNVGWLTSTRIDRQLVCDAFNYALAHQGYPTNAMVHAPLRSSASQVHSTVIVILEHYY